MKKIFALFVILCLGLFAFVGCGKDAEEKTIWDNGFTKFEAKKVDVSGCTFVNEGKITVSVSTDYAPYEFVDLTKTGQDKYVGSDIALAQTIADAFGLELYIKAMDFDSTLVALDNGIVDIAISGFSYTPERASSYLYTDCYFAEGDGGQIILIKKVDEEKFTSIESMNKEGIKIAGQNGAIQQDLVTKFTPNATLVKIDDLNSAYDELKAGSLDGVALAKTVADALIATNGADFAIMKEPFKFDDDGSFGIVKNGNTVLAEKVNQIIKEVVDTNTYAKWIDEGEAKLAGLGENAGELIPEE